MEQRVSDVRNSDSEIDFGDVFGGAPTWTRYSYGGSRIRAWEETMVSPSGSVEKPVFGGVYSSPRRRTSDDSFRRSDESVRRSCPMPTSLPAKMTKVVDIPVFGSNEHRQNNQPSRFSSPATQILRNNSGSSTGQTLSTRKSSSVKDSLNSKRSTEKDINHKSKARTGSSSIEFHFSMHKWANVGVPSLMSLHEGIHPGTSKVSAPSVNSMHDSGFPNRNSSAEKHDMNHVSGRSGTSLMEAIEKESLAMKQEVKSSLLHDEIERKGYEVAGGIENIEIVSGKKKRKAKKMNSSNSTEAKKHGFGSPKNRVKVMVKDLFKMSIQEGPPKTKTKVSSIWKTRAKKTLQEEVTDIISNLDTNVETVTDASKTTNLAGDYVNMMPDASFMVKEETERSNKQKLAQNRTIRKLEDINFQMDTSTASESVPGGSKASDETMDEPSLDHFWVEELAPVESEAMMALDSKIHTWSSGRTGNIRSLLSTLQLVLWAESGWKPVALGDIIEANALKKAYNRAMLCLHPDKLQQKGTDSHNKYIAEKVLDILQEAWDHWNSLNGAIL